MANEHLQQRRNIEERSTLESPAPLPVAPPLPITSEYTERGLSAMPSPEEVRYSLSLLINQIKLLKHELASYYTSLSPLETMERGC